MSITISSAAVENKIRTGAINDPDCSVLYHVFWYYPELLPLAIEFGISKYDFTDYVMENPWKFYQTRVPAIAKVFADDEDLMPTRPIYKLLCKFACLYDNTELLEICAARCPEQDFYDDSDSDTDTDSDADDEKPTTSKKQTKHRTLFINCIIEMAMHFDRIFGLEYLLSKGFKLSQFDRFFRNEYSWEINAAEHWMDTVYYPRCQEASIKMRSKCTHCAVSAVSAVNAVSAISVGKRSRDDDCTQDNKRTC